MRIGVLPSRVQQYQAPVGIEPRSLWMLRGLRWGPSPFSSTRQYWLREGHYIGVKQIISGIRSINMTVELADGALPPKEEQPVEQPAVNGSVDKVGLL